MQSTSIHSETAEVNFFEFVGDTLTMSFKYISPSGVLIDLTGWIVAIELRKAIEDANPILMLDSVNGGVQLGGVHNIAITLSSAQTATLGVGGFYYFIRTTDTVGIVNTLIVGKIILRHP